MQPILRLPLHGRRRWPGLLRAGFDRAVGAGFIESLARPGRNATGFTIYEYGMSGKWLDFLKDIAPGITRAAVLRDPAIASGIGQFAGVQAVAPSLGVELTPVDVHDAREIERAVTAFARSTSNGGLSVTASALATRHRDLIIALAARHRLPAPDFFSGGGAPGLLALDASGQAFGMAVRPAAPGSPVPLRALSPT
jgi:hypothetical protein